MGRVARGVARGTDADGIDDVVVAVCSPVCCHHHLVLCRTVIKEVKNLDPKSAGK